MAVFVQGARNDPVKSIRVRAQVPSEGEGAVVEVKTRTRTYALVLDIGEVRGLRDRLSGQMIRHND
jgi:hypothetical protein